MQYLEKTAYNICGILLVMIISTTLVWTSESLASAGMAALVIMWVPAVAGLGTILLFFLSRLISKKLNWIISFLGILFMLAFGLLKLFKKCLPAPPKIQAFSSQQEFLNNFSAIF